MPSVSPEIFRTVSQVSRYVFAFLALVILLRVILRLVTEGRYRRERLRNLPGSGMIGELVVITGNEDLPEGSFLPVPREGILGSVRSCDLVVPAGGVHRVHLDFSWKDGVGLLISPRSGCTVVVNSALLDHRSPPDSAPMIHGSFLQIGAAVLRLRVYAALDNTAGDFSFRDSPQTMPPAAPTPAPCPLPYVAPADPPTGFEAPGSSPQTNIPSPAPDAGKESPAMPRRRRAASRPDSSWKEDWGE